MRIIEEWGESNAKACTQQDSSWIRLDNKAMNSGGNIGKQFAVATTGSNKRMQRSPRSEFVMVA